MLKHRELKQENISDLNRDFLLAIRRRDYEVCLELLKLGANINSKFGAYSQDSIDYCTFCGPSDTPITHAVKIQDVRLVKFLLENKADTEVRHLDKTPLMEAAFKGDVKIVEKLLKAGVKVNATDSNNLSALHYLFLGSADKVVVKKIVNLLLEAGSNVKPQHIFDVLKRQAAKRISVFEIWKELEIENAYVQGAVAGALSKGNFSKDLIHELGVYVGTFLSQNDARQFAKVSRTALFTAHEEKKFVSSFFFNKNKIPKSLEIYSHPKARTDPKI